MMEASGDYDIQHKELSPESGSSKPRLTVLEELNREISHSKQVNADLGILLENTTTEHSTQIETELHQKHLDASAAELLSEIKHLNQVVEVLQLEKDDLELLLETTTQHADFIEMELEKRNALIRNLFGRYLDNDIVDNLLGTPEGVKLGGKRQKITMLVSDLRGFTAFSEQFAAEEVVKVINFYLSHMVEVIGTYYGTIDEFMGDGILVFFGAPIEREDDAARAVACAISMQAAIKTINAQMEAWNVPQISMGIGINTGEVVVGNIGSEKRAKYGVVGNQVNLTFRLESYTIGNQILISEATRQALEPIVKVNGSRQIRMKGLSEPITVHDVAGIAGKYNLWLDGDQTDDVFLLLKEPIPVQCEMLDGKEISDVSFAGRLVKLSGKGAVIRFDPSQSGFMPEILSNLKIHCLDIHCLDNDTALPTHVENYAKVMDVNVMENSCHIHFTTMFYSSMPTLKKLYQSLKNASLP